MNRIDVKRWGKRLLVAVVAIELSWLLIINGAMQWGGTQDLVNKIKPEKFQARWDKAWSWYPGHATIVGGFANGQSRSQQWQFSAQRVSARIALLPLVFKRVWISGARGSDIDYRQRPRMKPDRDYTPFIAHYPDIEGFPISDALTTPLPDRRPWKVSINNIELRGKHQVWIHQFEGSFDADLDAELQVESRGGPLALHVSHLDIDLGPAFVNGKNEMLSEGSLVGTLGFVPFNPRENKGLPMLDFLYFDLELDLKVNSLAFLDLFLLNFERIKVDGSGHVSGHLAYDQATVLEGTDLAVNADDLRVSVNSLEVIGDGDVNLRVDETKPDPLTLDFLFSNLEVRHEDDENPMLTGQGLNLGMSGAAKILLSEQKIDSERTLGFSLEGLAVTDLATFQRYLPRKWPFKLHGGEGLLSGHARISPSVLNVDLTLQSERADMGIRQYRFDTNLDAALKLDNPFIPDNSTNISGTYISLSDAHLQREDGDRSRGWEASISIDEGMLGLIDKNAKQADDTAIDLLTMLASREARTILAESNGRADFEASVSSLAFIGILMGEKQPTKVAGRGEIAGTLVLDAALPAIGTEVDIRSDQLEVTVLDYVSTGDGHIAFRVEEGGQLPDWQFKVALKEAAMRRQGEDIAGIQQVNLEIDALLPDMSFEPGARDFDFAFRIPSAKVIDMAVFNGYLPPDTPFAFTGGKASLVADIRLRPEDADGYLRLDADTVTADLDGQAIIGDLNLDIAITDGRPREMLFDISGSKILIDNVRVEGDSAEFDTQSWSTLLTLTDAETQWVQPPAIRLEAELEMSDSRPFVAMFENSGGPSWLGKMLEVEGVAGKASMNMADQVIRIPSATVKSDDIDIAMRALISEDSRNGMIHLRYKKLKALLKVKDGKRNVDIINTRDTFDRYTLPE